MKFIGMGLSVVMLFSCTKQNTTPSSPERQPEKPVAATISLSSGSLILYSGASEITKTVSFEITSTSEISKVWAESPTGINTSLTLADGNLSGVISISSTGSFTDGSSVKIKADNDGGTTESEINLTAAYLRIDKTSFAAKASGASVTIGIETNLSVSVTSEDSWLQYQRRGTSVDVTIVRNDDYEPRNSRLLITEPEGILNKEFSVSQEAATNYSKLERDALIALFNATDGANWEKLSNTIGEKDIRTEYWCTDKPISQWYGVEVSGDGHVMYLQLGSMNLKGELPDEIGDLVFCQELVLSNNNLSGSLPSRIGDMQALKSIQASNNNLSGELSSSSLSKLASKMKLISLSGNSFTGSFPQWIGDMPDQCNFWLQDNCLEGKVPQKVVEHPRWTSLCMDGSGRTIGQVNMTQKEGFVLTE